MPRAGSKKKISDLGVWLVELVWSFWAYIWLYVILEVSHNIKLGYNYRSSGHCHVFETYFFTTNLIYIINLNKIRIPRK
jgi:hypothetical protein